MLTGFIRVPVPNAGWSRRPASPTTRIRMGMATIATITRTSKETMAMDKVLPPREGTEAAGFVLPGRPRYYSKGRFRVPGYRLWGALSPPLSTILAKLPRSSARLRSGLERMFATVSPTAPPGGSA
jgi:hypothetical protein